MIVHVQSCVPSNRLEQTVWDGVEELAYCHCGLAPKIILEVSWTAQLRRIERHGRRYSLILPSVQSNSGLFRIL